jgi:hypothetical protein
MSGVWRQSRQTDGPEQRAVTVFHVPCGKHAGLGQDKPFVLVSFEVGGMKASICTLEMDCVHRLNYLLGSGRGDVLYRSYEPLWPEIKWS